MGSLPDLTTFPDHTSTGLVKKGHSSVCPRGVLSSKNPSNFRSVSLHCLVLDFLDLLTMDYVS